MNEIQTLTGFRNRKTATRYVKSLLESGRLMKTYPDSPNHPGQKYVRVPEKGDAG